MSDRRTKGRDGEYCRRRTRKKEKIREAEEKKGGTEGVEARK